MQPQPDDYSINLPITFDYRGGRNEGKKGKIILGIVMAVLGIFGVVAACINENFVLWQKILFAAASIYISTFVIRFFVLKELYFSDIYETLKESDFELDLTNIWQIFDIDYSYPYICYFKNGRKGIFVKMEKDAITGKADNAMYMHYEAISDAYNMAHSLNMSMVHIDYMDNVGNDPRLQTMYNDLSNVSNPDMHAMLVDMYSHLQDEMSRNYASFDIYLFLTRDKSDNFAYNVQSVVSAMLGGNFITYKILNRQEISGICSALFNLHDFSVVEACENVLGDEHVGGIVPICVTHADGSEDKLNMTQEEKRIRAEERERKRKDAEAEAKAAKKRKKRKNKVEEVINEDDNIDLFN